MCIEPPHGMDAIRRVYGNVQIGRVKGKWEITGPPHWEARNCTVVRDFPGLSKPLYVHKLIEWPLRAALTAALQAHPEWEIKTVGCFCPRPKASGAYDSAGELRLSLHSLAIAVDFNAATNPMKHPLTCDIPAGVIEAFEHLGWTWGGKFPTPDPMHFQYGSGA